MKYNLKNLPPFVRGELSHETWNDGRRSEILELFRGEVYGRIYDESSLEISHRLADSAGGFMDARAERKIIEVIIRRKEKEFIFPLYLFIPKRPDNKPVPAILTLVNRAWSDADPSRRTIGPFWPAEMMVSRGYAAAVVITQEIAPDYEENFTTKFHRLFPEYVSNRPQDAWGSISAWAWCMSRAIDYLASDPAIDSGKIVVAGHSRGGKTSLWCGAQDPRVSLVISSCSGCSGAAITRGKIGEHINNITENFPFWFSANYRKYADNEDTMPFDQHFLLALIAPRPLYISSRTQDSWCDPRSEYESMKQASAVYKLYGKSTILDDEPPAPEEGIVSGNLAYHIKSGGHNLEEYDWERYLNFCDRHFKV